MIIYKYSTRLRVPALDQSGCSIYYNLGIGRTIDCKFYDLGQNRNI